MKKKSEEAELPTHPLIKRRMKVDVTSGVIVEVNIEKRDIGRETNE